MIRLHPKSSFFTKKATISREPSHWAAMKFNSHFPTLQSDPPAPSTALRRGQFPGRQTLHRRAIRRNCLFVRNRGFALIATLSLMILLVVITVGLLGLSSIALRSTQAGRYQSEARANARLALMLAIGELQKELGPDQRISAPGGQLLEEGDNSARNHWTGVYESWHAGSETRPNPVFRRWLISGNESDLNSRDSVLSETPLASEEVTLVPGDAESDPVKAGVVSSTNGSFAWWVADENTKAKLGGRVEDVADADASVERMQTAPRAAHEVFIGAAITRDAPEFDRLLSTKTVDLLGVSANPTFHHLTSSATGLLTNVRSGGFKKDLSFHLEKASASADRTSLYTAGSTPGINFYELWRDYNVWGEIEYPSNPPNHQDNQVMPSGVPTMVRLPSATASLSDPFLYYRTVTKLQTTLICSLIAEKSTTGGTDDYKLFLIIDPVYSIWNPFNIPIMIPQSAFTTFKTFSFPYNLKLNLDGSTGIKVIDRSIISLINPSNQNPNFFNAENGRLVPLTMRPGEVQIQSQGFSQPIKTLGGGKYHDNSLGWDFGSGYKSEIAYETIPANRNGTHKITYSLSPNNLTNGPFGLFISSHTIGRADRPGDWTHIGGHNIDFLSVRQGPAIRATGFPSIFPSIPEDPSAMKTVAQLASGDKWPICVFTYGLRAENDPDFDAISAPDQPGTRSTARFLQRVNPKVLSLDMFNLDPALIRASPLQVGMRRLNSLSALGVECDSTGLGYYGGSFGSSEGVSYLVTHHVPTKPIHSLGALQHSLANGSMPGVSHSDAKKLLPSLSHPIANSFAPSVIAPDRIRTTLGGRDAADHSYLANLALWDDWFFSSISPETASTNKNKSTAESEQKSRLENFLSGQRKLPNSRMLPVPGDPTEAVSKVFNGSQPATDAHLRTAALMFVDGAFNVNSVSVPAWKSLLSGLKAESVPVRQTPSTPATPGLVSSTLTPVAGLLVPSGGEIPENSLGDPKNPEQWTGFRALTDPQIDELAKAIVKQVRLRGPFTSLADFINRRPGNDINLALSGALQSALDDPAVLINVDFRNAGRSLSTVASGFEFPEAEQGAKATGAPGYVKQGDLLTPLAPLISVRGDTFLIRSYGDARDKSGKITARAWCETVVRRLPEYVDPSEPADQAVLPTSRANITFGRRFEIISTRWLTPSEV